MKKFVARLVSVIAIAALVFPSVSLGFGGSQTSVRKTRDPEVQTSPNARAPLPYRFGNGPSVLEGFSESASKISGAAFDLTEPHDLPSDFNRPEKYSSFSTRLATLIRRVGMELGLAGPKGREIDANPSVSVPSSVEFDFDGDNVADFARWQPSTGEWKIKNSNGGSYTTDTLGDSNSLIAPGDFNGDGTTDVAVFEAGTWRIHPSGGSAYTASYGAAGDKPVVGDYDGDGTSDVSVFRPSNATWYIFNSSTSTTTSVAFGAATDIPVQGDYNGDGKTDIAVYRPGDGVWHILPSGGTYYGYSWGAASDIPVPEDYDGDGKTDYAVWRPDSGTWYVVKSSDLSQTYVASWGNYGDQPAPADYDGDGKAEMTVWRPKTGTWFAYDSCNYDASCGGGATYFTETLGVAGDTPVAAAYLKKSGAFIQEYDFSQTRLSPKNATGGTNLYSRNFSWGTTLVSLPGRAGLDAGLGIGYNSLVWIKDPSNSTMVFDPDGSNVAPGFNFGFPEIEPVYYNPTTQKYSYLMVTPSGSRIEFRQTAAKNEYETADSSYLLLKTLNAKNPNSPVGSFPITVTDTNGTVMTYEWNANAYRLKEIKDRNGNYITVSHDEYGLLEWVKDTLGRIITVNYDSSLYPISITQQWKDNNGAGSAFTRTYATFEYSNESVNPSFTGLAIYGPSNGTVRVLSRIIYGTSGSNLGDTRFFYNSFGQVKKVSNHAADGHELNYTATNLDTPGTGLTDVPRLSQMRTWVENFNIVGGSPQEVVVNNSLTTNQTWNLPGSISETGTEIQVSMTGHPHGHISRTLVGESGWEEGLPLASGDWVDVSSTSTRKRWTWNSWTQDDTSKSYILNPRVEESRVGDDENGNVLKTVLTYELVSGNISKFGLVNQVQLIDTATSTVLKKTETTYNLNSAYTSRRIIGLPAEVKSYGIENGTLTWVSRVTFGYDEGDFADSTLQQNISPVQHDSTNFGASYIAGRGNTTSTTRWDMDYPTSSSEALASQVLYNTAGAQVGLVDPLGRMIKTTYGDDFNDGLSRDTFAYATTVIDQGGVASTARYRYDNGSVVRTEGPAPNLHSVGTILTNAFDWAGRLQKKSVWRGGTEHSYVRYEYPNQGTIVRTFATLTDENHDGGDSSDELSVERYFDGVGRDILAVSEHPGSTAGFRGQRLEYDVLGRSARVTPQTEIDGSTFEPAGDDYRGTDPQTGQPLWLWSSREYDWKDRVVRTISMDGEDQLIFYQGCGCAGGEQITIKEEELQQGRRTRRIYKDLLGREYKNERLNFDQSVYSTRKFEFNGRDQVSFVKEFVGTEDSTPDLVTETTFDGHGRISSEKRPEQTAPTHYSYYDDGRIHTITDARGEVASYIYTLTGLVQQVTYVHAPGSSVPDSPTVTFSYDDAGNRILMQEAGFGSVNYYYNEISQLTSETRIFSELSGDYFTIGYEYSGNQLSSVTDPFGNKVTYGSDVAGRVTSIGGDSYAGITQYLSNVKYRAWGGIKSHNKFGVSFSQSYDSALRPSRNSSTIGSTTYLDVSYSYFEDGRLSASTNNSVAYARSHDREFEYDQVGRSTREFAHDVPNSQDVLSTPYDYQYSYDSFGNITSRTTEVWEGVLQETFNYSNNKVVGGGWEYDADGRITLSGGYSVVQSTYRSDGSVKQSNSKWSTLSGGFWRHQITSDYDGDGNLAKRFTRQSEFGSAWEETTTYYINSSVLGNVLTEVDSNGDKKRTFIRGLGSVIATQETKTQAGQAQAHVTWQEMDVHGRSYRSFGNGPSGASEQPAELTSEGTEIGFEEPPGYYDRPEEGPYYSFGDPFTCLMDGLETSCSVLKRNLELGVAVQCPNNYCGPVVYEISSAVDVRYSHRLQNVQTVLSGPFRAYSDGMSGRWIEYDDWANPNTISDEKTGITQVIGPGTGTAFFARKYGTSDTDIDELVSAARSVIEDAMNDPKGSCAKLLGRDALEAFDEISKDIEFNGKIYIDTLSDSGGSQLLENQPTISALTIGKKIYLNPNGYAFKDVSKIVQNDAGKRLIEGMDKIFEDSGASGQSQYAVAVIIHEFLHTTGKFKRDVSVDISGKVNSEKSKDNQRRVLKSCFKK